MLWPGWLKNRPAGKDLRVFVNNKLTMKQWCKLMAMAVNSLLGHIRKGIEGVWREVVFCLYSALKPWMEHCVQLWVPQYKNEKDLLDQWSEGLQRWLGDWSIFHKRKAWKSWDCSAWRREAGGCLTQMFKYLTGWNEGYNVRLFQWCSETRSNGHKLKTMKFHLNIRKYCSAVRVVKHVAQKGWHLMSMILSNKF